MLTNLTNKKKKVNLKRSLINAICVCASYIGHTIREKQLLGVYWKEVSLRRRLRKTPTDSSSGPSEMGARQVFLIIIIKYR